MAGTTGGNRPLSPHLTIYRPQITSVLSIFHRITGCAMAVSAALVVWWLLAAATGPEAFANADWWLTSWFGALVMLGSALAFFYHLCNGLRHLWWDIGNGFEENEVNATGIAVLVCAAALTLILLVYAL